MTAAKEKLIALGKEVDPKVHSEIVVDIFDFRLPFIISTPDIDSNMIKSMSYDIENLIEVYNPRLYHDVEILMKLEEILDKWAEDSDFIDNALGIEPE